MKSNLKYLFVLPLLIILVLTGCTNYGKKVSHGHIEIYYKEGISKEQAQKTADLFYAIDEASHNAITQKSMQLCKEKDSFCFRMVVDKKKLASVPEDAFYAMGNILSDSIFGSNPVNIDLTDNHFKTLRTLHYKKIDFNAMPADSAQ